MRDTFKEFRAAELYCPKCKAVRPVRDHLLLVLPGTGEKHDLVCAVCGEPLGERTIEDHETTDAGLIVK